MANAQYSDDYRKFRELLVATRRQAGLTQQELAERLGKPQSYIAKVEGGERRLDVIEFVALIRAMGIDPQKVFAAVLK